MDPRDLIEVYNRTASNMPPQDPPGFYSWLIIGAGVASLALVPFIAEKLQGTKDVSSSFDPDMY